MEQPSNSSDTFNWSSVAPSDEHYSLALDAYCNGRSFPEIIALLEARTLSAELIPEVITAVAKDRAFHLFAAGKRRTEVAQTLTERGLSAEDAAYIGEIVERARDKGFASAGMGKWQMRSLIAGGILMTTALILYVIARLGGPVVHAEVMAALLGAGVLLSAFGGLGIAFGVRIG